MFEKRAILKGNVSRMYFGHWEPAGMPERMWSVN
jgi:hypothetical protein